MEEIGKQFLRNIQNEMDSYIENVDLTAVEKAANIILDAEAKGKRVHVTGIGKPGHVAGYIASLLSSTGTPSYELHGTEAVHGSSGQVLTGDVVIAISNSGETSELKATVDTLLKNGARIISCTGNEHSSLAQSSEVCLKAQVGREGDSLNKPPRVKWHPGGSLGKSIREMEK